MAREKPSSGYFLRPIRRILIGLLVLVLVGIFLVWRIDSPRVERMRVAVIDAVVPSFDWVMAPVTKALDMIEGFQSYAKIYEQNQELRRELRQMKAWREAALQLEQKNAKLLDLNKVRLDPKLTFVTGIVLADSGSPFRQSVILNVGARDGIRDGWATTDGLGVVGRVSGVGQSSSRVILLTDSNSRLPITIQPAGQRALLVGDNTPAPPIEFLEHPELVRAGDRVVTSGDGNAFPPGLLVGQVAIGRDGRLRVRLSADYESLEFLRVLRSEAAEKITDPGSLIEPPAVSPEPADSDPAGEVAAEENADG